MSGPAITVAVVGATGLVGQEILAVLAERQFPAADVRALASAGSAGMRVSFAGRQLRVAELTEDALHGVRLVFFAAPADVSAHYASLAAHGGAVVVDTSGHFADDPDVPLVAPEVNPDVLCQVVPGRLVTAAGGATAALAAVLKALDAAAGLRAVSAATYEPVSGIGQAGVSELSRQTIALLGGGDAEPHAFAQQIAFNCIPAIGAIDADGHTTAERTLIGGLRRLLGRPALRVAVTAVRVPVFFGLGVAVTVETERALEVSAARALLREAPGLLLGDGEEQPYASLFEVVGADAIHVGRLRAAAGQPTSLCLWVAVDNVRKGTAVNAVAIAERLLGTIG